jgi:hypothetical protein
VNIRLDNESPLRATQNSGKKNAAANLRSCFLLLPVDERRIDSLDLRASLCLKRFSIRFAGRR